MDGQWYSYDDSSAEPAPHGDVVTRGAYILFYQRRNTVPRWSASSSTSGQPAPSTRYTSPSTSSTHYTSAPPPPVTPLAHCIRPLTDPIDFEWGGAAMHCGSIRSVGSVGSVKKLKNVQLFRLRRIRHPIRSRMLGLG